ncbi:MAG TPA: tRNA lysidine(34) synthetase TilS [Mycobacteriales bacterium]|nr:tRNA lysidine(34) synthetase TilS [Mycobacteriales bacterium]
MSGPPVPVARTRAAVRAALADLDHDALVLVACSGGADSLALATATVFERPGRAGLVTVDHRLQDGSAERAAALVEWARAGGFAPAEVRAVAVAGSGGPEAAARRARYNALAAAATEHNAAAVLLGHTADDQAETVLLNLARGSGARSLAGMPPRRDPYRRPFLELPRELVRAAAAGLPVWEDPHNSDPAYARSRLRSALSTLDETLGSGFRAGLVRSARLLRADADALDALAAEHAPSVRTGDGLDAGRLAALPRAIGGRIIRSFLLAAGAPGGSLSATQIDAVAALVTDWHGQGPVAVAGGLRVVRVEGVLRLESEPRDSRAAEA